MLMNRGQGTGHASTKKTENGVYGGREHGKIHTYRPNRHTFSNDAFLMDGAGPDNPKSRQVQKGAGNGNK